MEEICHKSLEGRTLRKLEALSPIELTRFKRLGGNAALRHRLVIDYFSRSQGTKIRV